MLHLCVLSLLSLGLQEPSNPPSPSGGPHSKSEQNSSSDDGRETEPPKSSICGSADTVSAAQPIDNGTVFVAVDDRQQPDKDSNPSGPIEFVEFLDSLLGIGLIAATGGLVYFTKKQAESAKQNNLLSEHQHEVSEKLFSIQSQLFSIQAERFRADHRPVFELRNIVLGRDETTTNEMIPVEHRILAPSELKNMIQGTRGGGYFEVVNSGGLSGNPIRAYMCCRIARHVEVAVMAPPWKKTRDHDVLVGRTIRIDFTPEMITDHDLSLLSAGICSAYLLGAIQYKDWRKGVRTTAFCRRYNLRTNEFESVGNPQYEFQE